MSQITQTKSKKDKTTAVVLAVFFGLFAWLYTYNYPKDRWKFWLNLALVIFTGIWAYVGWVWAIVDASTKNTNYFNNYPSYIDQQEDKREMKVLIITCIAIFLFLAFTGITLFASLNNH